MKQIYKISDFFPENPGVSLNDWLGIMKVNLKDDTKPTRIERLISKLSDIEDSDELELAKKDILQIIYSNIDGGRDMYCSGMELKGKEGYENAADVIAEFEKNYIEYENLKKQRLNSSMLIFTSLNPIFSVLKRILTKKIIFGFIRIFIKLITFTLLYLSFNYFEISIFPSSFEIYIQNYINMIDSTITEYFTRLESLLGEDKTVLDIINNFKSYPSQITVLGEDANAETLNNILKNFKSSPTLQDPTIKYDYSHYKFNKDLGS